MASVLIVDDAAFMRLNIRRMLEANGHTVAGEAENGKEAVAKYLEVKPDIVLMDITMPEMDGIEALKRIKVLDEKSKIVICSAVGQQQMVATAIQCGAENFIVKPFEASVLIAAINKVLA